MNLYKALNDDYREFKLHESVEASKKTKVRKVNTRAKLNESTEVNVSNEGNSTDVNIVIDNNKVEEPVIAPVVEEPAAEEVTSEVEEPTEEVSLEEESDKPESKSKGKKIPIHNEISKDEAVEIFRQMVRDNPKNEKAKEFLRKYDPEFKEAEDFMKESAEDVDKFWEHGFNKGDKVESSGAGEVEILDLDKGSDYIIVKRNVSDSAQPFVAAWAPALNSEGKLFWGQGHYYDTEDEARDYFTSKINEACGDKDIKEDDEVVVEEVDSEESNGPTKAAEKLEEIIRILDEEGSVDFDIVRNNISTAMEWLEPYIKDSDDTEVSEEVVEEEPLEECEVKSFNILRMSPKSSLYMIEADKVDNSRVFIVGRNFNSETNMLDEAEIFEDKDKATSKFRDVLYTVNNSKKGE